MVAGAGAILATPNTSAAGFVGISYNGFDWTSISASAVAATTRTAVAYGNGVYIAVLSTGASANRIDVFQAANFNLPKIPPTDGPHSSYIRVS
jgi:hypothetical protein